MMFESLALQEFPDLTDRITKKQINLVLAKHDIMLPKHYNSDNKFGHGVYKFGLDMESDIIQTKESPEELDHRIKESYDNLETLVQSVGFGITKSLIVSGAAGIGKSHTVRKVLEENELDFIFVKGFVKATGIFKLLYDNRFENCTIVFDDADSVFFDETGLNLLKGALELQDTRKISWLSEKSFISEDGESIPKTFDYQGTVIFLTNLDFDDLIAKGNKLAPHLQALESRSLYFDLGIKTRIELMARIKQVVLESNILKDKGISQERERELLDYLELNVDRLKDLSLRSIEKLAALSLASNDWVKLANSVMLRRN